MVETITSESLPEGFHEIYNLDLRDKSLLIIRFDLSKIQTPLDVKEVFFKIREGIEKGTGKKMALIACPMDFYIEELDERDMESLGWVRKEKYEQLEDQYNEMLELNGD